ncbi:sugar transferase [Pseudalkalibacillus sp. JSM 102089]|uniref:sugar transferase n=1 Tax=Pseudalkalibacillus sp. JSM 102089 TaxID=3229856 RepID=UPI003524D5F7
MGVVNSTKGELTIYESHENENKTIVNESNIYLFSKRTIDFWGAFLGLILLSPLFLILYITIKIEDPRSPVFFKQIRVGKNGKQFHMYKFRSMVSNAEELLENLLKSNETTGPMFKMKEDPRITRIGKFIRKTSIDELPQLFNVIKGEMSLVGPRPALPREVKDYTNYDRQRLLVVPGCTGLWQVSGRSQIGFNEMVMLDLQYIKKRSVRFDLLLIIKTLKVFSGTDNAY